MFGPIFWGVLLAACIGLGVVYYTRGTFKPSDKGLTWPFYAGGLVLCGVVLWLTTLIGFHISFQNAVTYHENWGGYEVSVDKVTYHCHESARSGGSTGGCVHTYDADSYEELESYECGGYEGTGDDRHYVSKTCWHWVTYWRQVPYTQTETTWIIHTTLGDFNVGDHWLTENPEQHRIRPEHDGMDTLPGLPSGTPKVWQDAHDRIAAGDPGPVTKRMDYDNYILASQSTVLKKYSDSIDQYKKANLLPKINSSVKSPYYEDRVYFAGVSLSGASNWQWAINRFDAALGTGLQGDMHLVIVDANKVTNADDYIGALGAYWQSPEMGKDALSKNGIIVVIGTKNGGKTVEWARATTGMPVGNEAMAIDVRNLLKGATLTPDNILGHPVASFYTEQVKDDETGKIKEKLRVKVTNGSGLLEKAIFGEHKFKRVCMSCDDKGDQGIGYKYLRDAIQPGFWAKFWMFFIGTIINILVLIGVAYACDFWRSGGTTSSRRGGTRY